jgi:thiamine-monophosphate kinase
MAQRPRHREAPLTKEFERIAWLERLFARTNERGTVILGIGDDAAVLRPASQPLVWTTDACVENVHFKLNWLSAEDLGWHSYNAAVSDLAAMGARPIGALSSLALPANIDKKIWQGIARGQARAAKALDCPVIGGNLTRASEISIHTTAIGGVRRPLRRDGAQVGDEVWLVGRIGAAAAGLSVLMRVPEAKWNSAMLTCVNVWRRPKALLQEGLGLIGKANAAIDISDGLAGDASHIAKASGVSLVLGADAIESAIPARVKNVSSLLGCSALDFALTGGEDYALLATGKSAQRPSFARCIGIVERGQGVWLETDQKKVRLCAGFDHFGK